MDPTEFEVYTADLFRRLGYRTEQVGGSHDGGIDVIAEKSGIKHYIQCKKYFSKHEVGSPEVRNFYGSIADRLGNGEGWFITTNKFTPEAEKFAEDKPIVLINQFKLIDYIRLAEKQGFQSQPQSEVNLKCHQCGGTLVERQGKFGKFRGCSNYPKCKHTGPV
jgi:restriction system protein